MDNAPRRYDNSVCVRSDTVHFIFSDKIEKKIIAGQIGDK